MLEESRGMMFLAPASTAHFYPLGPSAPAQGRGDIVNQYRASYKIYRKGDRN
jgi:hypothetical protein